MSKVIWHITMSLDGFIAGADDEMDWVFEYWASSNETATEVIETTGSILLGRRTYEVEDRDRPGFYGGAWTGPFFVLTHNAPTTVPDWMTGTFINEPIDVAVAHARQAARERNVVILGANVAHQCLQNGLLDGIVVHLAPTLLGDGVRLFGSPGQGRIYLERTSLGQSGQLTDLRFRVAK